MNFDIKSMVNDGLEPNPSLDARGEMLGQSLNDGLEQNFSYLTHGVDFLFKLKKL
jgi:hypothetical protein